MSQGDNRWWESYFLRYAVGSVVGAVMIFVIIGADRNLNKGLFIPTADNFSIAHLALYGALGLAYCYIASAPILVMHFCRGSIRYVRSSSTWRPFVAVLAMGVVGGLGLSWYYGDVIKDHEPIIYGVGALNGVLIVASVFLAVRQVLNPIEFLQYYRDMDHRRSGFSSSFKDSYRHLREHGNAFSIIVLELVVGLTLYVLLELEIRKGGGSSGFIFMSGAYLALWVGPACLAWIAGSILENAKPESDKVSSWMK